MTVLVPQQTFLGLGLTDLQNTAFFNVCRTVFAKASATLQQLTGLTQRLGGGIAADPFHGWIPGRNSPLVIHGKHPIGHAIDNPINKAGVPYIVGFFGHGTSGTGFNSRTLPLVTYNR